VKAVKLIDIAIAPNRQRKELEQTALIELAGSIAKNGLLHPIVVRDNTGNGYQLVAGERRLKAIEHLWFMGESLRCGDQTFSEGTIPCTYLGDLDPVDAFEAELEENLRRQDLEWQDRCEATSKLFELRRLQAEKAGREAPTVADLSKEIRGSSVGYYQETTRREIIMAKYLKDPDVAAAKTVDEGFKIIKRKENSAIAVALGESVGRSFNSQSHTLIHGDCLSLMKGMPEGFFDVILTDPPYGIDAQNFNDSGGKAGAGSAGGHTYDDSLENWLGLISEFSTQSYRVAKTQAHAYVFCDVENFLRLRGVMDLAGWQCFRTPLIWHNPASQRAPWPQHGPHRRWQMCLYAIKGGRPVLKLAPDMVTYASDQNLGWAAQKPVALYTDLLARSCRAGDSCFDPFCGSGTVFPAAHGLKIKATGIELDPTAYGIAVMRLGELK
jgi:DNA modification methylase